MSHLIYKYKLIERFQYGLNIFLKEVKIFQEISHFSLDKVCGNTAEYGSVKTQFWYILSSYFMQYMPNMFLNYSAPDTH